MLVMEAMRDGALDRLIKAIHADQRDYKAISEAAGLGTNYVQQLVKDRKEPGLDRLAKVLTALGSVSTLYVVTGAEMTQEDEELLSVAASLSEDQKRSAIEFFRSLQAASRRR